MWGCVGPSILPLFLYGVGLRFCSYIGSLLLHLRAQLFKHVLVEPSSWSLAILPPPPPSPSIPKTESQRCMSVAAPSARLGRAQIRCSRFQRAFPPLGIRWLAGRSAQRTMHARQSVVAAGPGQIVPFSCVTCGCNDAQPVWPLTFVRTRSSTILHGNPAGEGPAGHLAGHSSMAASAAPPCGFAIPRRRGEVSGR